MNIKSTIVHSLSRTRPIYLYLLTLALVIGMIWVWSCRFYEPLIQKEKTCVAIIQALEQKKLLLPDLKYSILSLRNKNEVLKNDLNSCLLHYACHDPYLLLERILVDLDDVGLVVTAFVPQETKKKAFYARDTIGFKVCGDFEKIIKFFKLFNVRDMLATFKKATILHDEEGLVLDSTLALYTIEKE